MMMAGLLAGVLAGLLGGGAPAGWNGYAEADMTLVAPVAPGRILSVAVDQGERVADGQVLVTLDARAETEALAAAEAAVSLAQATLADLTTGSRPEEMAVMRATLHRVEAELGLARRTLARSEQLLAQGRVPQATVDQDRAALGAAAARVEEARAALTVASLPAREGRRRAAEAAVRQARAEAAAARVALEERSLRSPVAGLVEARYREPGEVVAAGAPILALYDPDRLRAVFFLPEADRMAIRPGSGLALSCSGCPAGLRATVTRLGTEAEYTPPILYSRDERARLVFRAEARIPAGAGLMPGQPVTLAPLP